MPTKGSSNQVRNVRWPWLLLSVAGLLACGLLLWKSPPKTYKHRRSQAPAPAATQAEGASSDQKEAPAPQVQAAAPPPPRTEAPGAAAPAPEPALKDEKPPAEEVRSRGKGAKPPAPPPPPAPPMEAAKPMKKDVAKPQAIAKTSRAPRETAAPKPALAAASRAISADDEMPEPAKEARAAPPAPRAKAPHKKLAKHQPVKTKAEGALGKIGTIGHAGRVAAGPIGPEPTEGGEDADEAAPPPRQDGKSLAKLLPGRFTTSIPKQMILNQRARVQVLVSDKATAAMAETQAAQGSTDPTAPGSAIDPEGRKPTRGGPRQVVSTDMLIGKLLRVELRAFSDEFEISPITPAEQRLIAGQPAEWDFIVIAKEEGEHELSVVVTNLTDWSGRPLNLRVQTVLVNVEVTTMQRIRGYASLVSSAVSGLAGFVGAWMALLKPLLLRRRDQDGDDRDRKDKKDGKPDKDDKATAVADAKPAQSAAATSAADEKAEAEKKESAPQASS